MEGLGGLKQQAGKSAKCVDIIIPPQGSPVTEANFAYRLNKNAYKRLMLRDGMYLLRTNTAETAPDVIWQRYVLLTQVEAAFKSLKSDLAVRPVYHQLEHDTTGQAQSRFAQTTSAEDIQPAANPHISPKSYIFR